MHTIDLAYMRRSIQVLAALLIFQCAAARAQQPNPPQIISRSTESIRTLDYWSEQRMNNARAPDIYVMPSRPRPQLDLPKQPPKALIEPRLSGKDDVPEKTLRANEARPVAFPGSGLPAPNGKLFFTQAGVDYVCSASAISTDLILTAAHCAYGSGVYSENILFILQKSPTDASKRYTITQNIVPGDWINSTFRYSDQAIMRVQGTLPFSYGVVVYPEASWALPGAEFGYPAASPFPGNQMYFISPVEMSDADPADKLTLSIFSDMTGGSSGGPWVGRDKQGNPWYVFGLNSYKIRGDDSRMYSPYFAFIMEALVKCAMQNQCN